MCTFYGFLDRGKNKRLILFSSCSTVLGSSPRCDIRLKNDGAAARQFQIDFDTTGRGYVKSLSNQIPTLVNEQRLDSSWFQLHDEDVININQMLYTFKYPVHSPYNKHKTPTSEVLNPPEYYVKRHSQPESAMSNNDIEFSLSDQLRVNSDGELASGSEKRTEA